MVLFYSQGITSSRLIGYNDARYKSDHHKTRSQTDYLFFYNDTSISWRSTKQILEVISTNHYEIIAFYEVGRMCVWLRSVISHI